METTTLPSRISRVYLRYRHLAQDVSPKEDTVQERGIGVEEKEKEPLYDDVDEPLLIREQKGRTIMGRPHRDFHRRAAAHSPSNVLTVVVDVVATLDASGSVIGMETVTPSLPVVTAVPAVPTLALPSVPSVPAFPSDLTVPAYPWPSGVPSVSAQAVGSSSQLVISSLLPTSTSTFESSSALSPAFPSTVVGYNSTTSSTISTSSFLSTLNTTSSTSSTSYTSSTSSTSFTSSTSSSSSSSSSSESSTSTQSSSTQLSTSASSSPVVSTSALGGGGGGPTNTAPPPVATAAPTSTGAASSGNTPLDTPTVVGSIIGSLAGAALVLAILLFLIKRHKRKQRGGALQLPETADSQPTAASGQQMTTTRSSYMPAGAAAFFNRFSGASRSTADTSTTGERGFQRVSGRKLPSAFSEGMTSEQFAREGTLSGSSFYRDDQGVYGGPGLVAKELGKEAGEPSHSGAVGTKERIMPSPARTPVIHHPDDAPQFGTSRNGGSTLSPPLSPNPDIPSRGTLGRSHPSHDGSRGSKFTEDV